MSLYNLTQDINSLIQDYLDTIHNVYSDDIGLDARCGLCYVDLDEEVIIVHDSNLRMFNYYGGFEYVDSSLISRLGDYTVFGCDFDSESDRIARVVDTLREKVEAQDE